ncbi:MAG TPA: phenylalanine--tRNA ligase subunit beta [Gammaproteobacteria bacterium]|nr:phenylalanine--tRNA ligase subunit beta [Gammaproteobacteria bacterium]
MKYSVEWLRDWVDVAWDAATLAERLTMAGLEVDGVESLPADCPAVVARIERVAAHPQADQLKRCTVDAGAHGRVEIVCGAPNARVGVLAPFVPAGGVLPGGRRIEAADIRGVRSLGMLCAAAELGLGDEAGGLLELDADAVPGTALADYLKLDDLIVEVGLTPNRGDCLSMLGLAREIAALLGQPLPRPQMPAVAATIADLPRVMLEAPEACSRYAGRILRKVDVSRPTPLWMKERLRRCGLRSISAVVDITNYVMLELGQPLHAFDLAAVHEEIRVRRARDGESLTLLDGTELKLPADALVIADARAPLALAGVMGGAASGVGAATRDILLESAWFEPIGLSRTARRQGLHTDASHRFERGVDPDVQRRAIERATALVLACCGGEAGPVADVVTPTHRTQRAAFAFRPARVPAVLGLDPGPAEVRDCLLRLGLEIEAAGESWQVTPPSWRGDLTREVDLIEEVARLVGYAAIPETMPRGSLHLGALSPRTVALERARATLVSLGYFEAVSFSFIAEPLHAAFRPGSAPIALANPIAADMSTMRPSLVPGLLAAVRFNRNRQQPDVRLFEYGLAFFEEDGELRQRNRLSAVVAGRALPPQWGTASNEVDFFDLKQDLDSLLSALGCTALRFEAASHPAYHPRQYARVWCGERCVATLGRVHPAVLRGMDLAGSALAFEIDWDALPAAHPAAFQPLSRFPSVRRDLALVVAEETTAEQVLRCVSAACGAALRDLQLFDVYRGQGIDSGKKSLALGLIFQSASSTLTDTEIDELVAGVVAAVGRDLNGVLRT